MNISISKENLTRLKIFVEENLPKISIPPKDNWKSKTNDELWKTLFEQIVVIGSSAPTEKLHEHEIQEKISYDRLKKITNEETVKKIIHETLRSIGARYASEDITKCNKTKALAHNFKVLKSCENEAIGFFSDIAGKSMKEKISTVKELKAIGDKGARDLLMELGIIRDSVALDVRVKKSLSLFGFHIPTSEEIYEGIVQEILEKICIPLKIEGVQLDRLLYKMYDEIKKKM